MERLNRIFEARWFALIVIACVAFAIYSNTWHVPFVFDDIHAIENNMRIRDLSNFSSPAKFLGARAIGNFTFALNYRFGGLDVFGYHLVNILIHCANGFMVYFLSLLLLGRLPAVPGRAKSRKEKGVSRSKPQRKKNKGKAERSKGAGEGEAGADNTITLPVHIISLFAALIFVAHPLQTQAVTYIVQRYASLAAFFYMGAILFYLKARTLSRDSHASLLTFQSSAFSLQPLFFLLAFLFGGLAFLSKQTAASLPVAIILVEVMCFGGARREWVRRLLWMIPACVLFAVFILYAMGLFGGGGISDILEDVSALSRETELVSRWSYLCTQFSVLVIYLRLFVLPIGQNLDYFYPFKTGFFDGLTPLAFAFLAGLAVLAIWKRKSYPLFTFALFWFFVTLSVESSIIPISDALFEHRLYLPLFGFALFTAWLPFRFFPKRRVLAVLICVSIIASLGTATFLRNRVWKDGLTLWTDVLEKSPRNPRAALNRGNALGARGRSDEAMRLYTRIKRSNPDSAKVHHNMGIVYEMRGDTEGAISSYREALRIDPGYAAARYNLANILKRQGKLDEALAHYREVLRTDPRNAKAHNGMGITLLYLGDIDRAFEHLSEAVRLDPKNDEACNNLGGILETKGDLEGAALIYAKALVINAGNPEARANLSRVLGKAGDRALASRCYGEVMRSAPGDADLHMDFGVALSRMGDLDGAVEQFEEAVRIKPEDAGARYNLALAFSRQGRFKEAVKQYRKSLETEPQNHKAQYNLALALYSSGDFTGAVEYFKGAMRQEPNLTVQASYNLARAYAREGKIEESTEWLRRAVDSGFNNWNGLKTDEDLENIRGTSQYRKITEGK